MNGTLMIGSVLLVLLATCCTTITARATALTSYTPDPNMCFQIQNRDTGKCLDVIRYPGTTDGANVQTYRCEHPYRTNDQVWRCDEHGRLINQVSGKCLDVQTYRPSNNRANIQLATCEEHNDPRTDHVWDFEYGPIQEYVRIRNRYTDKCLDVVGNVNPANGVNVHQYDCEHHGNSNSDQWWKIIPIVQLRLEDDWIPGRHEPEE